MDQNFRVGEVFADRFEIEAVMAETALGTLALVKDSSCGEQRLVEFLAIECDDARCDEIRHIASDVRTIQHKSIAGLKDFEVVEGVSCVEMEPVVGETLDNHLAVRRGRGQILGLKVAYSFWAHICLGLELLHKKGYFYGSLRPTSIFVTNQGRIRVANFLCAWIAEHCLASEVKTRYLNSPFVAPEVRAGGEPTAQSDVYSLAVLMAELLSSMAIADFTDGPVEAFIARIPGVSSSVREALIRGTQDDPSARFATIAEFKDTLKTAVDAPADNDLSSIVVGVNDLRALLPSGDFAVVDPSMAAPRKPDLFDKCSSGARPRAVRQDVWIFVRDGVDYGPFDHAAIMKRFYDDEINESTGMFNTQTKKHQNLGSIDEFKKEIEEYLPTRDHNRRVKAEQELQKQKRVKAAGVSGAVIVLGVIAAFACVPFIILLLLPEPKPLDVAGAFAPFEKTFEAPKIEEVSLNMDDSKAKALFDPKATEAEREAALAAWEAEHRKKFAGKRKRPGGAGANNPFGEEIDTFVFTGQDGEELEPLSDWEIEEEVMSPRVYRKQADCFAKYAGGRGVSGKIDFVINQTGTTRSFSSSIPGELGACLISSLSSIKFRPFGGTVKRVSLPVSYGR